MPARPVINQLKNDLIAMGEMCENAISTAIMALIDRNEDMAESIIEYDAEIDEMELEVGKQCVDLLEKSHIKGAELRFLTSAMKIASDLERIGDNAVEICEHVRFLVSLRSILSEIVDFSSLVEQVSQMTRESIRALVEHDTDLAWKMIDEHLVIQDEMNLVFSEIVEVMYKNPRFIERCCHILALCKALQRVGDLTTNIAEEVIYLEEGKTVRHHIKEYHPVSTRFIPVETEKKEEIREQESILVNRHSRRYKKRKAKTGQ